MTRLEREVRRETRRAIEQGRPLIVSLEPGDTISFRQKGRRKVYRTTLAACFWLAVKADAKEQKELKKTMRKRKDTTE